METVTSISLCTVMVSFSLRHLLETVCTRLDFSTTLFFVLRSPYDVWVSLNATSQRSICVSLPLLSTCQLLRKTVNQQAFAKIIFIHTDTNKSTLTLVHCKNGSQCHNIECHEKCDLNIHSIVLFCRVPHHLLLGACANITGLEKVLLGFEYGNLLL